MADEIRLLVDDCRRGDERAMAALVDRFRDRVFGLCLRMVGQRQDAEDVTQETFVRALRSLSSWDSQRDFQPWLLAIAGNRCRTLLAARKRRPQAQHAVELLPDTSPDSQQAKAVREELQLALSSLREEYRQAFVLFHNGQLSYAEIAVALDCPVGTVKTWVHRARRELADRLRQRGFLQESPNAMR
ncbi:MAG TPA: sigma-70 family RNA polymerase sigma factor [Pirellulales bacterium]|nr:sigma-70 family RNA polymerase sigma factor [Pirellulales bacterium]